jgi:hypothetical protein
VKICNENDIKIWSNFNRNIKTEQLVKFFGCYKKYNELTLKKHNQGIKDESSSSLTHNRRSSISAWTFYISYGK